MEPTPQIIIKRAGQKLAELGDIATEAANMKLRHKAELFAIECRHREATEELSKILSCSGPIPEATIPAHTVAEVGA